MLIQSHSFCPSGILPRTLGSANTSFGGKFQFLMKRLCLSLFGCQEKWRKETDEDMSCFMIGEVKPNWGEKIPFEANNLWNILIFSATKRKFFVICFLYQFCLPLIQLSVRNLNALGNECASTVYEFWDVFFSYREVKLFC